MNRIIFRPILYPNTIKNIFLVVIITGAKFYKYIVVPSCWTIYKDDNITDFEYSPMFTENNIVLVKYSNGLELSP